MYCPSTLLGAKKLCTRLSMFEAKAQNTNDAINIGKIPVNARLVLRVKASFGIALRRAAMSISGIVNGVLVRLIYSGPSAAVNGVESNILSMQGEKGSTEGGCRRLLV